MPDLRLVKSVFSWQDGLATIALRTILADQRRGMFFFHITEQRRVEVQVSLLVPSCAEVLLRVFRTISLFLAFLTDGFSFAVILSGILQNSDVEEMDAEMLVACIAPMRS